MFKKTDDLVGGGVPKLRLGRDAVVTTNEELETRTDELLAAASSHHSPFVAHCLPSHLITVS